MEASPDQSEGGFGDFLKKAYSLNLYILSYMISCFKEFWLVFPRGYDSLSREFKRTSLKGELKKQKQAVAEKMLSAGIGDEGTRKLLLDKTNALKQAIANQAPSSEKASIEKDRKELIETFFSKSIDTFPASDDAVLEFQKAKQSLDTFEKSVASASASQIPIKKGKAALGFFMVFLAFCFVAAEKKEHSGANSETNKEKAVAESRNNTPIAGDTPKGDSNPELRNPNYAYGFDHFYEYGKARALGFYKIPLYSRKYFENDIPKEVAKLKMEMMKAKQEFDDQRIPLREAIYQQAKGRFDGFLKGAADVGLELQDLDGIR
jgi:hypothetical protein